MPETNKDADGLGPMRARMVATMAEFLDIPYERASDAMHAMWEATKDIDGGSGPWTHEPNLKNPGIALAHRVQMAMAREFDGEDYFPAVVVVQSRTGHVGLAATAITGGEVENLLRLGIGAARRNTRQHGGGT